MCLLGAEIWAWRASATKADGTRLMLTTSSLAASAFCQWAESTLYFCQLVLGRVLQLALEHFGLAADDAPSKFLEDNRSAPDLAAGRPIDAPRVDNGNILARGRQDADKIRERVVDMLRRFGLAHRAECSGSGAWDVISVRLNMARKNLCRKPARMWRLRRAILELHCQGHFCCNVLHILVGHTIYNCLLFWPALSILQDVFVFIVGNLEVDTVFSERLLGELRAIAAVPPFLERDLRMPTSAHAFMSDASLQEYALREAKLDPELAERAMRLRERWMLQLSTSTKDRGTTGIATQDATYAAEVKPSEAWADPL